MKVSPEGLKEIKKHEGEELVAYKDSVGVWTIGVGHTAGAGKPYPKEGMTITSEESSAILARDLSLFEKDVLQAVSVPLNQNQFDALVSLAFNIGSSAFGRSTLVKKLNARDYEGAAKQFLVWNKAGGKVVKGLVNRRAKEKAWFEKSVQKAKPVEKPVEAAQEVKTPEVAPVKENWLVSLLRALKGLLK